MLFYKTLHKRLNYYTTHKMFCQALWEIFFTFFLKAPPFFFLLPKNNKSCICENVYRKNAGFVGNLFNIREIICRICGKYHKTLDNFQLLLYNLIKQRIRTEFDFLIVCLFSCLLSFVLHIILSFDLRVLFLEPRFFIFFHKKLWKSTKECVIIIQYGFLQFYSGVDFYF